VIVEGVEVKDIPGFPGYAVSRTGRVWSSISDKWLSPYHMNQRGYLGLHILNHRRYVHRLVLEAWVGSCPVGMGACHNNGIWTDNRVENLRWDTQSSNCQDTVKHGNCPLSGHKFQRPRGENSPVAKLTERDVRLIIYQGRTGLFTHEELGKIYGVNRSLISQILRGELWKHIWKEAPSAL
jgi:hypothetical protein